MAVIALVVAFAVAAATTPLAARLARRTGIVDHPGTLKRQTSPVPYLGGLAVFAAVAAGAGLSRPAFLLPLALALCIGVADDRHTLGSVPRLVAGVGVGAVVVAVAPVRFGGPVAMATVVLAVVVLINAVNLIDGIDALASGVVLVAALGFALILDGGDRVAALALAGAVAGFLVHNRPPARIYLGDGGAYLLGTALALLLATAWGPGRSEATSVAALALVVLPATELGVAVVRRTRARRSLFTGDRAHSYDQLVQRGWSAPLVSVAAAAAQAAIAGLAIVARGHGAGYATAVFVTTVAILVTGAAAAGFLSPDDRPS